ncbi:MAG: 4-(cytidine 5'-diphospho)-2-C-methyl-D-erythritol kinase [Clostridium sp.]|jgi:4-diphosphocytidyl-2-C-methyl-D-erythritol kinase|uniref:4-(cytidine 5'-diphospho)-2-C-methyl-D-erythritol kinase n=1 Tax=Clostridium sp. TaxID=1506 RepID=UPI0025BC5D59|nr:4-(cytidine 5'-diphospho)-2-C-methyl-D-erythritol kinase [Clostridium sp.]MCH3965318.1 4-(cytidine 5'-diphospho)-2-C-methyl-D-erythritol kinase [Clostridium sp.]MCI1714539.1 4-(cytidine 5'-diphospho)-2-C-methyl-D-erythritol kinase [Clostridium sp.]MCI1798801.1 4-(cytidine 5'-diphospho)-2-C-methyl-D-erythritol kinase [Clostridium sp.]MCI1812468.1 4-(cytidine 5'-diphospho)-2-C-methyl-D-erythritol kinase [Clostridium sp.]MCI1869611.1 4-(cytidine 5'-diphospho)-2-C-methyl-D-erythritol kinase [Cl
MLAKAYAKINLSLDVIGKRKDGYHFLKMIMQTIDLYDILTINRIDRGICIYCNKSYIPLDNRNLAYKAAELFMNTCNIKDGIKINIEKHIPVSAGLAGGSTDAAAVLRTMRNIYKPNLSNRELERLALKIGTDVVYCISGGTALCEGIGEKVTRVTPFRNQIIVLIKPPFGVSSKEVYSILDLNKVNKHPDTKLLLKALEENDAVRLSKNMKNVLENVVLKKHHILKRIKREAMAAGALGALMSGSGPTIFAVFDDIQKAQLCYDKMKAKYKEVFITRTI